MLSTSAINKGKGKEVKISLSINRSRSSSATSATNMPFDVEVIPDDIWLTIFEQLGPGDLSRLSATCQKFHHLTQRPLLREITWSKASSAERNIRDWGAGGSLAQFTGIVRKVKVRLSFKRINQNNAIVAHTDWEFYDAVFHRLMSFGNLRSLELVDTIVTPALYPVLAAIPSLRELNITRCTFLWSPLYPPILSTLGRPNPPGGIPDQYTMRRNVDEATIAAQRQWFTDNHTFDFPTQLAHITHLTFKYNRSSPLNDDKIRTPVEDLPYMASELNKITILHPLYLLTLPSLTELTLTWSPLLMTVFEALKNSQSLTSPPGNLQLPGGVQLPMNHPFHHLPHQAHLPNRGGNPFGINVFVPLRPSFPSLQHVTLLVDDLSRDMMDSLVGLFEQRVNSPAPGLGPLRTKLRVAKHSLTEQHLGSIQFRLPGVYHYEGPLQVAGLLAAGMGALNIANPLEEIRMGDAMEMNMILYTLEKLPRSLKKLDIKMYKWDQEILYAVRALFKELRELVIRYGRGGLKENTHVILGSDILPELQQLHTLRLLPSGDCVKRDQQRHSFPSNHGTIHHINPASNTWWAMTSTSAHTPIHHHHHLHPHPHQMMPNLGPGGHMQVQPLGLQDDDEDDEEFWSDDLLVDFSDEDGDLIAPGGPIPPSAAAAANAAVGGSSAAGPSSSTSHASTSTQAGPSTGGSGPGSGSTFGGGSNWRRSAFRFPMFSPFSNPGGFLSTSYVSYSSPSASTSASASSSSVASTSTAVVSNSAGPSTSTSASTSAAASGSASASGSQSHLPSSMTFGGHTGPRERLSGRSRHHHNSANLAALQSQRTTAAQIEAEEQRKITESLKEDLADYLVGWNRHCPRLRVVQMEHGLMWVRRFDGDVWTPVVEKDGNANGNGGGASGSGGSGQA
ncbi:hypothetical protein CC2G_004154 [Coprinopsis cinerea AmutBmut pab1-1]|nr:hypothetical protein CC2G_004154 [Coprinopsis cinerea AmutBmut pab1-1]